MLLSLQASLLNSDEDLPLNYVTKENYKTLNTDESTSTCTVKIHVQTDTDSPQSTDCLTSSATQTQDVNVHAENFMYHVECTTSVCQDEISTVEDIVCHNDKDKNEPQVDVNNSVLHSHTCNDNDIQEVMGNFFSGIDDNAFDEDIDDIIDEMISQTKLFNQENLVNDDDAATVLGEKVEIIQQITEIVTNFQDAEKSEAGLNTDQPESNMGPLYPDSPYSLGLLVLLICCFLVRFRLPDEAATYMLKIIACVLPQGHTLFRSLYHFRKFIKTFTEDMFPSLHYYCNSCYSKVERNDKVCSSCKKDLTKSGEIAYFVHLKIISQLRTLWKIPEFSNNVRTHRFQHIQNNQSNFLKDVYDGQLYRDLFENGVLKDKNNLSFSMNTDGVPLFKSSKVSMWPVYMLINELPIAKRKHRQNSLLYGVWISSKKPQMWSFLRPLYLELKHLETEGETFEDCDGNSFLCRCFLLTCTCDLPARALVYNATQYNGDFSCTFCLNKGETHKLETGGIVHIFPYNNANPKGNMRTKRTVVDDVKQVQTNVENGMKKFAVHGHKGPFWFLYLKYFNPVYSCVIDYMHGVCLGVTKQLLNLWFHASHKNKPFSVYPAKQEVNRLLTEIQPTVFVTRVPRLIDDVCHWKSSEFRNFLLYWSIPIMSKILTKEYFVHFCLLVRAIFLLSMESISPVNLATAEGALLLFVENYERLYEVRYATLNLHQLVHLVDCVKHTGPVFVNNCFIFEDLNGYLLKHIHGTQGVENQLGNIIGLVKAIPIMSKKYLKDVDICDNVFELYNELTDSIASRRNVENEIEDGIVKIGHTFNGELNDEEVAAVSYYGLDCMRNVYLYYNINMYKKGFYVYGKLYKRLSKRQQHVITYCHENEYKFGSVRYFIEANLSSDDMINLALVEPFRKVKSVGCVWKVEILNTCIAIPLKSITNVNNFVGVHGDFYVCPPPNRYERD